MRVAVLLIVVMAGTAAAYPDGGRGHRAHQQQAGERLIASALAGAAQGVLSEVLNSNDPYHGHYDHHYHQHQDPYHHGSNIYAHGFGYNQPGFGLGGYNGYYHPGLGYNNYYG
ncbi:hypothetical protein Hamer_G006620 [Homarus americanus]|uniref:Uncharacterized protein n=1 Tax=Homarus americanus TaxID=6706 RepID=A0A8J5MMA2_HOMAM|nr:hypothetical protein Hamer_G006620 [Homarus americanus]